MKEIYTKTGDGGQTSIRGEVRVEKDDIRIETNGQIDQLTALLGVVRAHLPEGSPHRDFILSVQREMMVVMSHVATPDGADGNLTPPARRAVRCKELTLRMEQMIDEAEAPAGFIIPGGGRLSAFIHVARTQARTAERRLWTLNREHPIDAEILKMMNRLSDYLFVLSVEADRW